LYNRITDITNDDPTAKYIDPASQINVRQLLSLICTAIHDDKKRIGTLEDALNKLLRSLFDIQRGYNRLKENMQTEDWQYVKVVHSTNLMETLWGYSFRCKYIIYNARNCRI